MKKTTLGIVAAVGFLAVPGIAMAQQVAYATNNVNVRAGPGTDYPVVDVARAGAPVYVHGCLSQRAWCDVDFDGLRGWMSSNYLAFDQRGRRYSGADAMDRLGTPIISFQFGNYWDRHYRGRDFYRDRSRWEGRRDRDRWEGRRDRDRDRWDGRRDRDRGGQRRDRRQDFDIRPMEETRQPEPQRPDRPQIRYDISPEQQSR
ncbi:MAG: SH3 domain-containing protein [Mesorhizobium sp.]|nr:SH3 domain-containing protein [Mesorhizobium sp.]